MESPVEDSSESHAPFLCSLHHEVDPFRGDLKGFFADDMLACPEGGERGVEVGPGRGAYGDDLQFVSILAQNEVRSRV